jgi:hypothetical protein
MRSVAVASLLGCSILIFLPVLPMAWFLWIAIG